jgi:hypothetical protein
LHSKVRMRTPRRMRRAGHCSAHGGKEASLYDLVGKVRRTEGTRNTEAWVEEWDGVDWIELA